MEYKTTTKSITIKRRIDPDDRLIHFIRHNSNKRRYIWNKFVEKYKEDRYSFDPGSVRKELMEHELSEIKDELTDSNIKEMYCVDLITAVYQDVRSTITGMITMYKKDGTISDLNFKRYDPFKRSFRVRTKCHISEKTGKHAGKLRIITTSKFLFKASYNYVKNNYDIQLMEPLADEYDENTHEFTTYDKDGYTKRYSFHFNDISDIIFMEELGKFYILLKCNVTYYNCKSGLKCRNKIAGIDLGIRTPVVIYDGDKSIFSSIDKKQLARMGYYQRRIKRLKRALDIKYNINKYRNELDPSYPKYSKRYRKLQCRFRRYHTYVKNIRRDWRFKLAKLITTKYKNIVVDEFTAPITRFQSMPENRKRRYNTNNRRHGMFFFMLALRHESIKNGCKFIDSPKLTTRTCAICGHVNDVIPLSSTKLICSNCGTDINRDINAAMNCYDFYFDKTHWLLR